MVVLQYNDRYEKKKNEKILCVKPESLIYFLDLLCEFNIIVLCWLVNIVVSITPDLLSCFSQLVVRFFIIVVVLFFSFLNSLSLKPCDTEYGYIWNRFSVICMSVCVWRKSYDLQPNISWCIKHNKVRCIYFIVVILYANQMNSWINKENAFTQSIFPYNTQHGPTI